MAEETYRMIATCKNCQTEFDVDIPKGKCTWLESPTCTYCGHTGQGYFSFRKPPPKLIKKKWFSKALGA